MSIDYTDTNKDESSDSQWGKWMDENPQEANDQFDNGHPTITHHITADFKNRKNYRYVVAPYRVYADTNMAYHEALPQQLEDEWIEELDESIRTVVPADHFLKFQLQDPNQRSQLPLGSGASTPPRTMTPPSIPFGQVVTSAGRVVNPPDRYRFAPEVSKHDAPPQPPTPEPQPLEGLEGCQRANATVL